jgi:RNA 2',3'-cyclic 3'-phosphodiesterase
LSTIRLFLALPLPDSMKPMVHQWSQGLRSELAFQKWVHPSDYHITLKFLGDTAADQVERIKEGVRRSVKGMTPFELRLEGLSWFGRPSSPSILWAGVQGDLAELQRLHKTVESAMEAVGFAKEDKAFRPHISLARRYLGKASLETGRMAGLAEQLRSDESDVSWRVDHVVLYTSHLGRNPMYEPLERFALE